MHFVVEESMDRGKQWRSSELLNFAANQEYKDGAATCPGCKTYRCMTRASYNRHVQQCISFQELKAQCPHYSTCNEAAPLSFDVDRVHNRTSAVEEHPGFEDDEHMADIDVAEGSVPTGLDKDVDLVDHESDEDICEDDNSKSEAEPSDSSEGTTESSEDDLGNQFSAAGGNGSESEHEPSKRTAAYYQQHCHDLLYTGCNLTVLQVSFALLSLKLRFHLSDIAMSAFCRLLAFVILPNDNKMPHNLYHLRKVLTVESSTAITYHCCEDDHFIWPYVPKKDWGKHAQDTCPIQGCGKPRFRKQAPAGATRHKLSPVKIMQYFGLERCIKHLHSLPEWNKARGQMCRDVNQTICTSFFGTKASKLLNERLGHSLHQPHIGIYEIGTDWFSFFSDKRKRCTTGVFFLRAIDLPDASKQKRMFHVPLMILPGPREPRCVDAYMDIVVRDFENWQPGTPGLQVKKLEVCEEHGTTTIRQETVRHWPTLASWIADNPARQKVAAMRGQAAIRACGYCWMHGVHLVGRTVFLGYKDRMVIPPANIPTRLLHAPLHVHTGDDDAEKTCAEMLTSGQKVQDHEWDSHLGGCNGLSPVCRLAYIDYKNVWALGIAHILLLGLIPDFFKAIFMKGRDVPDYVVSQEQRDVIRRREALIHMPTGMPRALSIVDERGNFEMSHYWIHAK